MHPAGGNPHDPIDPTAPLWVKRKHHSCKHCDKTKQLHGDTDCSNFEPKEIEKMKYTAFYRAFKRACDRADIGDRRPYDLRHTRITEVAKYMGYEQLNKFANKEDLVEDLLQYAEQHIDIRRVCMDRGFFSGAVVNTMDENDWKFIMPATRTSRLFL